MGEYKTLADLVIEAAVRKARWAAFRHVVYVLCAVGSAASLIWIAAGV